MRDMKLRHQNARYQSVGHENATKAVQDMVQAKPAILDRPKRTRHAAEIQEDMRFRFFGRRVLSHFDFTVHRDSLKMNRRTCSDVRPATNY